MKFLYSTGTGIWDLELRTTGRRIPVHFLPSIRIPPRFKQTDNNKNILTWKVSKLNFKIRLDTDPDDEKWYAQLTISKQIKLKAPTPNHFSLAPAPDIFFRLRLHL